jgi:ATP-dependent Lon protease
LSGYLKLLFPDGGETEADVEDLLRLAMESRKRVKDQLTRIDSTYPDVDFHYVGPDGAKRAVATVEEEEFPQFYHLKPALDPKEQGSKDAVVETGQGDSEDHAVSEKSVTASGAPTQPKRAQPEEGHKVYAENRKGISYDILFGPYIDGAQRIVVTDPYIRFYYQARNMMEFVEMVIRRKAPEDQVAVHLVTGPDDGNVAQQREFLESISTACLGSGVDFTWAFDSSGTAHARDIVTDTGWKIVLDRGLDIFQAPVKSGGFSLGDRLQDHRMAKGFYVTYIRTSM